MTKPSAKFAERTTVPVEKSKADTEKLLDRYGADQFVYGKEPGSIRVMFRVKGRMIRIDVKMPENNPQEQRRLWRSLYLIIKAKLEAVESGILTFEQEFTPYMLLPDGRTVAEWIEPQMELAYQNRLMPRNLPGLPERSEG